MFPPDIHTHNLQAPAGTAVVNIPQQWLLTPAEAPLRPGVAYSVGIHPWWTAEAALLPALQAGVEALIERPEVVMVGECGLDRRRGGDIALQQRLLNWHSDLAARYGLPLLLHCVHAYDLLLQWRRRHTPLPPTPWIIHGFRGGAATARQLLDAGFSLSYGRRYAAESYALTPPERRYHESDEDF
jgi:TatD DNase family protein